jgi:hypothetical protein
MRFHRLSAVSTTIHADRIDVDLPHSGHLTGTTTVRGRRLKGDTGSTMSSGTEYQAAHE